MLGFGFSQEMSKNLDKQDLNILHKLDRNSRASITNIAKLAKIPTETARYRIQRLCERQIITKFYGIVDLSKLGCTLYKIYFGLQNANEEAVSKMVSYLESIPGLIWMIRVDGKYDLALGLIVDQVMTLDSFLENFNTKFSKYIRKRSICINVSMHYLERDYLINKKFRETHKARQYSAEGSKIKVDELDCTIIEILSEDSRTPSAQIARDLSIKLKKEISTELVLNRIKRIEKEGIITGYCIILNSSLMDQLHIKVLLNLSAYSPEKVREFVNFCWKIPRVVHAVKVIGEWDYEIDLEVENTSQYREIMGQITSEHPELIRDYNALFIEQVIKYKAIEFAII